MLLGQDDRMPNPFEGNENFEWHSGKVEFLTGADILEQLYWLLAGHKRELCLRSRAGGLVLRSRALEQRVLPNSPLPPNQRCEI